MYLRYFTWFCADANSFGSLFGCLLHIFVKQFAFGSVHVCFWFAFITANMFASLNLLIVFFAMHLVSFYYRFFSSDLRFDVKWPVQFLTLFLGWFQMKMPKWKLLFEYICLVKMFVRPKICAVVTRRKRRIIIASPLVQCCVKNLNFLGRKCCLFAFLKSVWKRQNTHRCQLSF